MIRLCPPLAGVARSAGGGGVSYDEGNRLVEKENHA